MRIAVGGTDPVTGELLTDIAASSRSMHKTEGFGNFTISSRSGPRFEAFQLLDGTPMTNDVLDGVETALKPSSIRPGANGMPRHSRTTSFWRRRARDGNASEHQCEGWLEGYLLTGRHGLFNCYEAFIHIVDSMFNQHAKWLKVTSRLPWRRKIASLNYLLASHVWRQDHNGFTHQDPGFIDHVVNKKAEIVRAYLPPDANCLLSVIDHCLRSRHYVNVVIAGKHPAPQWLTMDAAVMHCAEGIGIWQWASNDSGARYGARCGHGVRGRRADLGDARRGLHHARTSARLENPRGQRR